MKSKSNPDILKMAAAAAKRSERTMRSKVGLLLRVKSILLIEDVSPVELNDYKPTNQYKLTT